MIRLGGRVGGRPIWAERQLFFSLSHCWLRWTKQESSAPRLATHLMAQRPTALMCAKIVRSVPSVRASRDLIDSHWTTDAHAPSTVQVSLTLSAQSLPGQWATSPALRASLEAERLRARLPAVKGPAIGYRQRHKRACAVTTDVPRCKANTQPSIPSMALSLDQHILFFFLISAFCAARRSVPHSVVSVTRLVLAALVFCLCDYRLGLGGQGGISYFSGVSLIFAMRVSLLRDLLHYCLACGLL